MTAHIEIVKTKADQPWHVRVVESCEPTYSQVEFNTEQTWAGGLCGCSAYPDPHPTEVRCPSPDLPTEVGRDPLTS